MARIKKPEDRKILLNIARKTPVAIQELARIRGNSVELDEGFDTFKDSDRTIKLMKKKKATLFVSADETHLVLGRTYDSQFTELFKFKILRMRSSAGFAGLPAEICVKYFLLLQGIKDERLKNFIIDLFRQRSYEVDLHGIRYAWIFNQSGAVFTLKYVRVLKDHSVEDIGPLFEMELESSFCCGEELWEKALAIQKGKKTKNVEKNVFHDKIGKIHVDKQDLREIKLKRSRGHKNKGVATEEI